MSIITCSNIASAPETLDSETHRYICTDGTTPIKTQRSDGYCLGIRVCTYGIPALFILALFPVKLTATSEECIPVQYSTCSTYPLHVQYRRLRMQC